MRVEAGRDPIAILRQASPEVQRIVNRVIQQEYLLLHMKRPDGINQEIEKIVREEVSES